MQSYPRENNLLSQSTPENLNNSFQGNSSNFNGSVENKNWAQPGGRGMNEIPAQANPPIVLKKTTHPSGVVPRPSGNSEASEHQSSFISQPFSRGGRP